MAAASRGEALAGGGRPRFLLIFLAYAAKLSGGDRHLLEMAARWRDEVDVSVLAPPHARGIVNEFLGDVEMHLLGSSPPVGVRLAIEYVRRSIVALARPLPRADVALASSHFMPDATALASLVRNGSLGVGYVYHLLAGRERADLRTLWSQNDERVGLAVLRRYANVIFVSNDATAASLAERGLDPIKTAVGIDLRRFRRAEVERIPNQGLFVGRMAPSKGVRDAVEAWAQVCAVIPSAKLIMAGEGPEVEPARALSRQLGVEKAIEFAGFVSEEEKRSLLLESSVFLAPSHEEGWGIAVGEALASRIPVVAYQLQVLDELFPSSYLAVPFRDRSALVDALVRILTDSSFPESVVREGFKAVSRYDVARVAARELETILQRRASQSSISTPEDTCQ